MYAVNILWCKHCLKLLQFSVYNVLHHLQVLLITRVKTAVIYINDSKNVVSDQRGISYVRWGRKTCRSNAARIYEGMTTACRSTVYICTTTNTSTYVQVAEIVLFANLAE